MPDLSRVLPKFYGPALADLRQIVIHSVESGMTPGIGISLMTGWWQNPDNKSSVHGIADPRDYVPSVPEDQRAWHCGAGNPTSAGIEHSGRAAFSKDDWLTVDAVKMLNNSARNTARMALRHDIPLRWLSVAEVRSNAKGFCFTEATRILTKRGLVPASAVVVGDEVWTHRGRWRPVTATMSREADLVELHGQGHSGIRVTPEHPFLARRASYKGVKDPLTKSGRNVARVYSDADWVDAGDMAGYSWMTPILPENEAAVPALSDGTELTAEDVWIVGRWVADGHIGDRNRVVITVGDGENSEFRQSAAGSRFTPSSFEGRPGVGASSQIRLKRSQQLAPWLSANFGEGAHHKHLPTWLLFCSNKMRQAFLDGYLSGDGYLHKDGWWEATTVSQELAIGLRILGTSLGLGVSSYLAPARVGTIAGRAIKGSPTHRVRFAEIRARNGLAVRDGVVLGTVKSVQPAGSGRVYNITVAEDESYLADGFIVHNCTHNDMRLARGGTTHTDPGPNFPYALYMQLVQQWAGVPVGGTGTNTENHTTPAGPGGAQQEDTNDMADITPAQMDEIAKRTVALLLSAAPEAVFAVDGGNTTLPRAISDLLKARLSAADVWNQSVGVGYAAKDYLTTAAGNPKAQPSPGN